MAQEFGLDYKVIGSFFDRHKIERIVSKSGKASLPKAGAFVRKSARQSMRRTKRAIAKPGQPPRAHDGRLKTGIVFAYDPARESVVIGPLRLNVDAGAVPRLLEFGGDITRRYRVYSNGVEVRARGRRLRSGERFRVATFHYHAFPYMGPALSREAPKFPDLWAGTVH